MGGWCGESFGGGSRRSGVQAQVLLYSTCMHDETYIPYLRPCRTVSTIPDVVP